MLVMNKELEKVEASKEERKKQGKYFFSLFRFLFPFARWSNFITPLIIPALIFKLPASSIMMTGTVVSPDIQPTSRRSCLPVCFCSFRLPQIGLPIKLASVGAVQFSGRSYPRAFLRANDATWQFSMWSLAKSTNWSQHIAFEYYLT